MTWKRWDFYFDRRAPDAWVALAAGIGLVFMSVRLAWGLQGQPATFPSLMQQILPSMIGGAAVGLMSWGVMRFRIDDHARRLQRLEEHKVDKELFSAELRTVVQTINSVTDRLDDFGNNQREVMTDLIDRLDRRSQDVSK